MHLAALDFSHFVCFLVCQDLGFAWVDLESLRFRTNEHTGKKKTLVFEVRDSLACHGKSSVMSATQWKKKRNVCHYECTTRDPKELMTREQV